MDERPPRGRWGRRVAATIIPIAAALIGATWLVGRLVSDRYGWSQWLAWIPTSVPVAAAVVALLWMMRPWRTGGLRRALTDRWTIGWAVTAVALLIVLVAIDHRLLRPAPTADGISVMQWTIGDLRHRDAMIRSVAARDADLTILSNGMMVAWHSEMKAQRAPDQISRVIGGFGVVTRLPIIRQRQLVMTQEMQVIMIEFAVPSGGTLVLYAVDLPSDPSRPRHEVVALVRDGLARAEAPPPDLVVGDFNLTRPSALMASLFPAHRHAAETGGHGVLATFPRRWPVWHIDHMLVGPGWICTRYDLDDPGVDRHFVQTAWIRRSEP